MTGHGRRMTKRASRAHPPSSFGVRSPRRTLNLLMRGPRIASSAGIAVSAPITARMLTAMPAYPKERRKNWGKKSRAARATTTVSPETNTVLPAELTVAATASGTALPAASSSRKRLMMRSE